jgi:hypothetical protein
VFYVYVCTLHGRFYRKIDDPICPKCNRKAAFVSENKHRPSNAWEAVGLAFDRERRQKRKREDNDDRYTYDVDEGEEEEIPDAGAYEEDGDEYLLPANFRPDMRYTLGRRTCNLANKTNVAKTLAWCTVGNAAVRKNATTVMGLSARKAAGRGAKYNVNKFKSCEWCHLLADSLGGQTVQDNLVASSFAANTAMLVIEKAIHDHKSKFEFDVCVIAYGPSLHVADFIKYKITCRRIDAKPSKKKAKTLGTLTYSIDGMNDEFSKADAAEFRGIFDQWLLNPSIDLSYQ